MISEFNVSMPDLLRIEVLSLASELLFLLLSDGLFPLLPPILVLDPVNI
jgi:hypothetical protein